MGDQFGFVAQEIVAMKVGGRVFGFNFGKTNDASFIEHTGDVALLEV